MVGHQVGQLMALLLHAQLHASTRHQKPNRPVPRFMQGALVSCSKQFGTHTRALADLMHATPCRCCSLQVYFKELPAGQEMSVEYKFRIAPQVPTRDFFVAIHLIYEDIGGTGFFSNVVFNGTVEVVEKAKLIDTEGIFMYIMILGTFGAIGFWAFSNASDKLGIKKAAKKSRKGSDKAAAFDEDEWVKGTPYDVEKRKKAAAATGKTAKQS